MRPNNLDLIYNPHQNEVNISFISVLGEEIEISIQGKQKYTFVIINSLKMHIGKA